MAVEVRSYSRKRTEVILTVCPACGYPFSPNERRDAHIAEHSPEDFGLGGGLR